MLPGALEISGSGLTQPVNTEPAGDGAGRSSPDGVEEVRDGAPEGAGASEALDPAIVTLIETLAGADAAARHEALRAIASNPTPHAALWPPVEKLILRRSDPETRLLAVRASWGFRTRESITLLDEVMRSANGHDSAAELRQAASESLGMAISQRGLSHGELAARVASLLALDDYSLTRAIADAHAASAFAFSADRDRLRSRLLSRLRELALRLTPEERDPFLAPLLSDEDSPVRRFAGEMVRQIASERAVGPLVERAVVETLASQHPSIRAEGALLVNLLAPEGAGEAVARALAVEADPAAAEALLQAGARWPGAIGSEPVLRWLAPPGRVRLAAADCVWAMHGVGLFEEQDRTRALSLVRRIPDDEINPSAARILFTFGEGTDRTRLGALLVHPRTATRSAAAGALAASAEYVETLVATASTDPQLAPIALNAAIRHLAPPEAMRQALRLGDMTNGPIRQAVGEIAGGVPTGELVRIARESNGTNSDALLSLLLSPERAPGEGATDEARAIYCEGLLDLAEHRLREGRIEPALAVLERVERPVAAMEKRARTIRLGCLLGLSAFDRVGAVKPLPDEWLPAIGLIPAGSRPGAAAWVLAQATSNGLPEDVLAALRELVPEEVLTGADGDEIEEAEDPSLVSAGAEPAPSLPPSPVRDPEKDPEGKPEPAPAPGAGEPVKPGEPDPQPDPKADPMADPPARFPLAIPELSRSRFLRNADRSVRAGEEAYSCGLRVTKPAL